MFTRATHLDVAAEYSTEAFLQAFRRFTSVKGTPEVIFSDSGTQLVGAHAIIQAAKRDMDRNHATGLTKTFVESLHRAEPHGDKAAQSYLLKR